MILVQDIEFILNNWSRYTRSISSLTVCWKVCYLLHDGIEMASACIAANTPTYSLFAVRCSIRLPCHIAEDRPLGRTAETERRSLDRSKSLPYQSRYQRKRGSSAVLASLETEIAGWGQQPLAKRLYAPQRSTFCLKINLTDRMSISHIVVMGSNPAVSEAKLNHCFFRVRRLQWRCSQV